MDENKMEMRKNLENDMDNLSSITKLFIVGLIAVATWAYFDLKDTSQLSRKHEEAARYIAMQNYVPVGNGGALAEMNGKISPERKKMYHQIKDTYFLNMSSIAPNKVIEKANRLRDPNLTEAEREEISNNIDYIPRDYRM